MIRVALVQYRDHAFSGGALRVGGALAKCLPADQVCAELVFAYGGAGPVVAQCGVRAHFLNARSSSDWRAWVRARRFFQQQDFDVIHFVDPVIWISMATFGLRAKRVIHVHERPISGEPRRWKKNLLMRWLRFSSHLHIAVTEGARRCAIASGWISDHRSHVVYPAVDAAHFRNLPSKVEARRTLNLPAGLQLAGFSARLVWWKGADDFLRVLQRLPDNWQGVIAGCGPEESNLRATAVELGVSQRVHFIGLMDDPRIYLAAVDCVTFFSRSEPFGLVIAEAMAAGVPVFGLLGEGEYTEPEWPLVTSENSFLVRRAQPHEPRSVEAPEVLTRLADHMSRQDRYIDHHEMSRRAQAWVQERFDAWGHAAKMAALYQQLVSPSPFVRR